MIAAPHFADAMLCRPYAESMDCSNGEGVRCDAEVGIIDKSVESVFKVPV